MKIVVVDDDPVARLLIEVTLSSLGHEVVACGNGQEAWNAVFGCGAQLVVSDWMMPGMDGLELCRRLKNDGGRPVYFILVSSTLTSPQREQQAVEAGVDHCVRKPAIPEELGRRVSDLERHLVG